VVHGFSRTVLAVSATRPTDAPRTPGVYEFLDATGRVLYIGKAKSLAERLASYFPRDPGDLHPRTRRMVENAVDLRWTVCASETEALVLEREWVLEKQPPYNVRLRTGSGYAGVALTQGDIPRLIPWRGRRPQRAESFGPYPGTPTGDLVDALALLFGVRTCDDAAYRQAEAQGRPCLLGETGKCLAPCVGRVDQQEHREAAIALKRNLRDPDPALAARLESEMQAFSADGLFEAAARRRDQLSALRTIGRRQRVAAPDMNVETLAVARSGERIAVTLVSVRNGVVQEVEHFTAVDDPGLDDAELLETVLALLPERPPAALLTEVAVPGARPPRGASERAVLAFARAQADEALVSASLRRDDPALMAEAGAELAALLGVTKPVRRIECVDISHTAGRDTVGSVVVLVDGVPRKDLYRRVHLNDFGGDDYAALRLVVSRRLRPGGMGHDRPPDLFVIDGGPGQVAAAVAGRADAVRQCASGEREAPAWDPSIVPLVGLAKRFEELWPEGAQTPLRPDPASAVGLLLRHVRDEAHRHALGGHRRQRERSAIRTGLEQVPGLGPTRRKALLDRFGSIDAVASATPEDLAGVRGIGPALAARIHAAIRGASTGAEPSMTPGDGDSQSSA
jgi:excinuclease ABC subunit C